MPVHPKVDVVTVGAGWTAGIMAWRLSAAGLKVVSLEQGPARWADPDFVHNHDSLRYMIRKAMMVNLDKESWTWRPNPHAPSLPIRQYGSFHPGLGVGGAGIHWAAQTWRFYPSDMRYRSHHIERYGADRIPDGCTIQDWPLTYEELEPHYTQMEYDIGVAGVAGNLNGAIQPGGNPFEGPRSKPYPLKPLVPSIAAEMFSKACTDLGLHPFRQPAAILSEGYQGLALKPRSGCLYCGFCTRYGCEVDAKASAINIHIPVALSTGRYDIRTHSKVLRINIGSDGLATGVTYLDLLTNEEHEQPADIVVLSAFTLENVRLMLLSRQGAHADGIGNDRGLVGKNYTYQLNRGTVSGSFEGRRFNQYMGNSCLQNVMHDYNADNFDHGPLDFIGGASVACGGGERQPVASALSLPVLDMTATGSQGDEDMDGNLGERKRPAVANEIGSVAGSGSEWGQAWKENLRNNWDNTIGIGVQGESLPYVDQFLDLDPRYRDAYGSPLLRVTFDWHDNDRALYRFVAQRCKEIMQAMGPTRMSNTGELEPYNIHSYQSTHCTGGAIMGTDPGNSVTNKYGQVWDTPNVFVTGAALYPQNAGMNPTGILIALAYHASEAIVKRYLRETRRLMA